MTRVLALAAVLVLAGCKTGVPAFQFSAGGLTVGYDLGATGTAAKEIVAPVTDAVGITKPEAVAPVTPAVK